ncbi:cyclic pyranopterin monophosphate synthase subunit MoaC [Thermodesulfobium acidiphilum]|uniref:cyclic pyranopterin monophosphate synthase n=1 Tax=Thermodesulfobium acidiphilum TaxID=1794699 RepID=A0A2R4W0N2_THEAF|nr:cyclic pyranopterin monophosphate synthase MoaC [Thermodesulfobium acidiphilum]AWB10250.1 cyclic pyranopterin monophosphate synthase subunit MoaC [Thermodesulfobium acidiphilum]PMP84606.1 MAG: cyclic pyranopterin monophosphate synthase MoaC [Thermodesulfobium narugense]
MFTHLDNKGKAHMVDIGKKIDTIREAKAQAFIRLTEKTLNIIKDQNIPKGDIFSTARIAGILAAKKTWELIPLTHPIPINQISIDFEVKENGIMIFSQVKTNFKTGVEMEALVAVNLAALTIYDMIKAVERGAVIEDVKLLYKSGGKSGTYEYT